MEQQMFDKYISPRENIPISGSMTNACFFILKSTILHELTAHLARFSFVKMLKRKILPKKLLSAMVKCDSVTRDASIHCNYA